MADRKFVIPKDAVFSTRASADMDIYYELKVTAAINSAGPIQCDLTPYTGATAGTVGTAGTARSFKGKCKIKDNKLRAVLHDTSDAISTFKLFIRADQYSPLRDRVILNKNPVDILDDVDVVPDKINDDERVFRANTMTMEDPDVESFQRVGTGSSSPTNGGGTAGNVTTTTIGKILPFTVIVKNAVGLVIAFDDGAGKLVDMTGTQISDSSVKYTDPWKVKVDKTANIYLVQAMIDGI